MKYEPKLLSIEASERPPASEDVWDIDRYNTWQPVIWRLISDFVGNDVKEAFLKNPPEYLVCDDLSWLDDLVLEARGVEVDSKHELATRLLSHFRAIRACHGTASALLDSFYEHGLRPLVLEEFQEQARQIFLGGQFPELSEDDLQTAIASVGNPSRKGHVYFEANEWFLKTMCGHYMLYGSEYLTALAAHLNGALDYRGVLKSRYSPTLFICDVPLEHLRFDTVVELAGIALEFVFQELLDGLAFKPNTMRACGFCILVPLDPSCIVGHCHPVDIRDPL